MLVVYSGIVIIFANGLFLFFTDSVDFKVIIFIPPSISFRFFFYIYVCVSVFCFHITTSILPFLAVSFPITFTCSFPYICTTHLYCKQLSNVVYERFRLPYQPSHPATVFIPFQTQSLIFTTITKQ